MTKVDKAVYKCPCCDYCTHFPKALEAHQRFRKHYAPYIVGSQGQEIFVPANTPINVVINGEAFDEKAVKKAIEEAVEAIEEAVEAIEEAVEESTVTAEKKKRTVRKPRKKAAEE